MKLKKAGLFLLTLLLLFSCGAAARAAEETASVTLLFEEWLPGEFVRGDVPAVKTASVSLREGKGAGGRELGGDAFSLSFRFFLLDEQGEIEAELGEGNRLDTGLYLYTLTLTPAAGSSYAEANALQLYFASKTGYITEIHTACREGSGEAVSFMLSRAFRITEDGSSAAPEAQQELLSVPACAVGSSVQTLSAAQAFFGGTAPFTYEKLSGPAWLTVGASDGNISGTPSEADAGTQQPLVIRLTDAEGRTADCSLPVGSVSFRSNDTISAIRLETGAAFTDRLTDGSFYTASLLPSFGEVTLQLSTGREVRGSADAPLQIYSAGLYRYADSSRSDGGTLIYTGSTLTPGFYALRLRACLTGAYRYAYRLSGGTALTLTAGGSAYASASGSYANDVLTFTLPFEIAAPGTAVGALTLSSSSLKMKMGGTSRLLLTSVPEGFDPADAVWSSSNRKILTVENGVLTGIVVGVATVTAELGGESVSCSVSVGAPKICVTELENGYFPDGSEPRFEIGARVIAAANPAPAGQRFSHWEATGITLADDSIEVLSFLMPENDVKLKAVYVSVLPVHIHSLTKIPAAAPGCSTAGNEQYYYCTCGLCFSESRGGELYDDPLALMIPPTGKHIYDNGVCVNCGAPEPTLPVPPETAAPTEAEPTEPSETEPGSSDEPVTPQPPKKPFDGSRLSRDLALFFAAMALLAAAALVFLAVRSRRQQAVKKNRSRRKPRSFR